MLAVMQKRLADSGMNPDEMNQVPNFVIEGLRYKSSLTDGVYNVSIFVEPLDRFRLDMLEENTPDLHKYLIEYQTDRFKLQCCCLEKIKDNKLILFNS